MALAGLIHIAWGLRSYLPTCPQRSANTTLRKTSQNLLGQVFFFFFKLYIFLNAGSSQLQILSDQSTFMALAGLIHIAWGLRSYLPTCPQRSANTTLRKNISEPLGSRRFFLFNYFFFFKCWKFPTSNPFKPKHSHGPCRSYTHSLGSQIISSHMSSKISQHYIEKNIPEPLGSSFFFLTIFFFKVGSSQLQTLSNQSTLMALAGLIHIAWGLRSYLPTCPQRSANTTLRKNISEPLGSRRSFFIF